MSLKGFIYTPDCTILHPFFKIFSGEAPRTPTNGRGQPSSTLHTRPFGPREPPPQVEFLIRHRWGTPPQGVFFFAFKIRKTDYFKSLNIDRDDTHLDPEITD